MAISLATRPLTGALGVEIDGVDLHQLDEPLLAEIRAALDEHLVVFFAGQDLDTASHLALARCFGEVQVHAFRDEGPQPGVLVIEGERAVADFWHTDETYEQMPPRWLILRMVRCPPIGGDTLWINQQLVYRSLAAPLRELVDGLSARHVTPDGDCCAVHPLVLRDPRTGRSSLYVNRHYTREIVGLSAIESQGLLQMLFAFSEQPDFQCRYRWSSGALAVWDNRATQHRVVADYRELRRIERVAVV